MAIPVNYEFENLYNSRRSPSTVHCQNNALVNFFQRYLLQKVISVFDFKGIPDEWADNYFKYVLFGLGYVAVFESEEYGIICQQCGLSGYDVFYQPSHINIANPLIKSPKRLKIGTECEIIKLQPDYAGVLDIVSTYADLMALSLETAGINLLNSKMSYVFIASDKNKAESFKKLYDQFASGSPAVFADKDLMDQEGESWQLFTQNVGQNYVVDRVLDDMKKLEDRFNTDVGIPNANTYKRERLISDEVNANNIDTQSKVILWLETMRRDLNKVNAHYGLNISVDYRYTLPEVDYER